MLSEGLVADYEPDEKSRDRHPANWGHPKRVHKEKSIKEIECNYPKNSHSGSKMMMAILFNVFTLLPKVSPTRTSLPSKPIILFKSAFFRNPKS